MTEIAGKPSLVAAVAPRLDEVVTRAARRALQEIPEYEQIGEAQLREGIARDLGLAMVALTQERELTDEERATMGTIGDTRAAQGMPLEGMLRVYRITIDEVFAALFEASRDGVLEAADALELTREAWRYAGPMLEVAVTAYRRRELEQAVADSQRRTALVHSLLFSQGGASPGVVSASGLDPSASYVAFVARSATADARAMLLDLQVPGVLEGGLVAPYEGDVVGLARRRPAVAPGAATTVAVGPPGPLSALPHSFTVAARVLEAATAFGRQGVLAIDQLPLEVIARSEGAIGDALTTRLVAPLQGESGAGAEILQTLSAFLAHDLSAEQAAGALSVHPNTVRNRLHRFEELTGASLRSVDDLLEIRLALLRAELASARTARETA